MIRALSVTFGLLTSQLLATEVSMVEYLTGMPKAEIHLHIEGSLSPEKTAELANKNNLGYF